MALACALFALLLFSPPQNFLADGLKALDANQPAAAEPLLRQAVEADPNDYSAHFNLGLALSLQQKDTEAIAEYREAIQLNSNNQAVHYSLGIAYEHKGNRQAALQEYRTAQGLDPQNAIYQKAYERLNSQGNK